MNGLTSDEYGGGSVCVRLDEKTLAQFKRRIDFLVGKIWWTCHYKGVFIDREDLSQEAYAALMELLVRFDSARGIKLATFADKRLQGIVWDVLRKEMRWRRKKKAHFVSLEEISSSEIDSVQVGCISRDYAEKMENAQHLKVIRRHLAEAIDKLPKRERAVMQLKYPMEDLLFDDVKFKDIGDKLDFSESTISQDHDKAVRKMRKILGLKFMDIAFPGENNDVPEEILDDFLHKEMPPMFYLFGRH